MTKSQRAQVVELLRYTAMGPLTVRSAGEAREASSDVIALADLARHETALELVTTENVTDEQVREYARDHWRDPWMGGASGKGCVGDAMAVLFSTTTGYEWAQRIRAEFARLVNARTEGRP